MFEKMSNSWQLVRASWAVLKSDKELIWFPVLSGITMFIITLVFLIPIGVILGIVSAATGVSGNSTGSDILGFALMFLFYLVSYTIVIFFNTALIGAAMIRLDGGDPGVGDGFRIATGKFRDIVGYALISATVGVILRFLEERLGWLGVLVSWIGGMAWNLVTFLVIPVLVAQDVGPVEAIKTSSALFKKTWGEQVAGNFSIGAVFFLLYLLAIIVGFGLIALAISLESGLLIGLFIGLFVFTLIALGILSSALNGIYQAALYRFAETGIAPDEFDIEIIEGAFKPKRKRGMV